MLEEDWPPGASLPWGPPPSFFRGRGLRRSAAAVSPVTREAVFTKAVGRDLWAPSHLGAWVPRCYLIKASLLDGPLSKQ